MKKDPNAFEELLEFEIEKDDGTVDWKTIQIHMKNYENLRLRMMMAQQIEKRFKCVWRIIRIWDWEWWWHSRWKNNSNGLEELLGFEIKIDDGTVDWKRIQMYSDNYKALRLRIMMAQLTEKLFKCVWIIIRICYWEWWWHSRLKNDPNAFEELLEFEIENDDGTVDWKTIQMRLKNY